MGIQLLYIKKQRQLLISIQLPRHTMSYLPVSPSLRLSYVQLSFGNRETPTSFPLSGPV